MSQFLGALYTSVAKPTNTTLNNMMDLVNKSGKQKQIISTNNATTSKNNVGGGTGGAASGNNINLNTGFNTNKQVSKPGANSTINTILRMVSNEGKSNAVNKTIDSNSKTVGIGTVLNIGKVNRNNQVSRPGTDSTISKILNMAGNAEQTKNAANLEPQNAQSGELKTKAGNSIDFKPMTVDYTDMYHKMNNLDFSKLQSEAQAKQTAQPEEISLVDQWNEQHSDWNTLQQYRAQFDGLYDAEIEKQRQNVPEGYMFAEPTQEEREQAFADTMKEWGAEEYLDAQQPETLADAETAFANAQSAYDAALAQKPEVVQNVIKNPGPATWIYYNMWKLGHQDEAKALEDELKGLKDNKEAQQEFRDNVLQQEEYYKAINNYAGLNYEQAKKELAAKQTELDNLEKSKGAQDDIDKLNVQIEALQSISENAHTSELESVQGTDPQFKTKADQAIGRGSDLEDYLNDSTFVKMVKNTLHDDLAVQNFMTQDEVDTYNYWFNVGGQEKAHEYIYAILPELKERTAGIKAEDSTTLGRLGYSLSAGYQSFFRGAEQTVRRVFGDKTVVDPSMDEMIQQKFMENTKGVEAMLNNAIYTVGNLLPTAATVLVTGGAGASVGTVNLATAGKAAADATAKAISTGMIGTSSFGNAYAQARNEGYSDDESVVYGSLVGGSEAFLTYFLTGVKMLGGGTATNAVKNKLGSVIGRVVKTEEGAKWLAGIGSHIAESGDEAAEEYLQQTFAPIFRNLSFGENNDVTLMSEEQLYAAIMGTVVSETMNAPYTIGGTSIPSVENSGTAKGGIGSYLSKQGVQAGAYNPTEGMDTQGNKLTAEGFNRGNTNIVSDASETGAEMEQSNVAQGTGNPVLDRSAAFAEDLQQKNGAVISNKTNPVVERLAAAIRDMQQNKGDAGIPIKTNPVVERMATAIRALQQNNKVMDSNKTTPVVEQFVHALQNMQKGKAGMSAGNVTIERIANAVSQMAGNNKVGVPGVAELTGQGIIKGNNAIPDVNATEGAGEYSSFLEKAKNVDVSTATYQAVYYSGKGNRALAEDFAKQNGKMILEMTPGGKYFDSLKLFESGSPVTEDQALKIWKILSERYAKGASGNVYGFVKGASPGSIFNTVEYPALQKNPNITNIFTELFK